MSDAGPRLPALLGCLLLAALPARAQQVEHVPPDAPASELPAMSSRAMTRMMGMDDRAVHFGVLLDELEWRDTRAGSALDWDADAWLGGDFDKLWFSSEGEHADGKLQHARSELAWDHAIGRWWNSQAGWRHDSGGGPARDWLAFGVRGLAPQFIELRAMAYVGEHGDTAARFAASHELLFTQRLIAATELELDAYGQSDAARGRGAGLSSLQLGLRLRYELRRGFAPYLGIAWVQLLGDTAALARADDRHADDLQAVGGLRLRF